MKLHLQDKPKCYFVFWWILIVIMIFFFFVITMYSYHPYYQLTGIYEKEGQYVTILLESARLHDMEILEIKVDGKSIPISNIEIEEMMSIRNTLYYPIEIFMDEALEQITTTVTIKMSKTTLWKQIKKGLIQ